MCSLCEMAIEVGLVAFILIHRYTALKEKYKLCVEEVRVRGELIRQFQQSSQSLSHVYSHRGSL